MVQLDASQSQTTTTTKQNGALNLQQHQMATVGAKGAFQEAQGGAMLDVEGFNYELVRETRDLMRHEYETNGGDEKYSSLHYNEIMDSKSPAACWRYLIQRDLKPKDAFELIKTALNWRKINLVDEMNAKLLAKDLWLKSPIGYTGKTRNNSDLVCVVGKNYRKPSSADVKALVRNFVGLMLTTWDRKRMDSLEKFVVVFDVSYTRLTNIDLEFVSYLVTIIDYYPARFESIHIIGVPFLLRPVIRLIISWLPDRYRRISHIGTMQQLIDDVVDLDQLPVEMDGQAPDTWRLAPKEAPWFGETDQFNETFIKSIHNAITFNTSADRIEQLKKMQLDYESTNEIGNNKKIAST